MQGELLISMIAVTVCEDDGSLESPILRKDGTSSRVAAVTNEKDQLPIYDAPENSRHTRQTQTF